MKLKVQTLDAKGKGDIELSDDVFGLEPRADILHRVVTWQLEKARGTARGARERSDVAIAGFGLIGDRLDNFFDARGVCGSGGQDQGGGE